jgi:hypothetical protein
MGWNSKFNEPIPLPKCRPLATLRDAALYITKLPKTEHEAPEWRAAMEALLLVAEHGGPYDVCADWSDASAESAC